MGLAVLFALVAAAGFAIGNILIRLGTQRVSPPTATFFTVVSGAVLVSTVAMVFNLPEIKSLGLEEFGWFALMGAMAYPFARVLNTTAISMVGASRAAPMGSIQPIFALTLGIILLGERPNLIVSLGTPVVVGGLVLVYLAGRSSGRTGNIVTINRLGYVLAMGSAAAFASRDVISRHVVTELAPPFVTSAFALILGGGMLLALTHRGVANSIRRVPPKYVVLCCLAGLFQGIAVASLFQALSRAPVSVVSPITGSAPLMTLALVHIFLQRLETTNRPLLIGTLLGVGGVTMVILGATR